MKCSQSGITTSSWSLTKPPKLLSCLACYFKPLPSFTLLPDPPPFSEQTSSLYKYKPTCSGTHHFLFLSCHKGRDDKAIPSTSAQDPSLPASPGPRSTSISRSHTCIFLFPPSPPQAPRALCHHEDTPLPSQPDPGSSCHLASDPTDLLP